MLGDRYPGGLDWLERRLDDIETGRADLWQVRGGRRTLGWAIVTPKGLHQVKLSTFYIAAGVRGLGLGRKLLGAVVADWQRRDILSAHVTVDESDAVTRNFFEAHGFNLLPGSSRAYGERFDKAYVLALDAPVFTGRLALAAACPS